MIQHRVERRKTKLRVVLELDLDEALGYVEASAKDLYQRRVDRYLREVNRDILEVLDILNNEDEVGIVRWFDETKGYGFLRTHERDDIFVHRSGIGGDAEFKSLEQGQRVTFKRRVGREGLEAVDVMPVEKAHE